MNNHVHLLLMVGHVPVGRFMQRLAGWYAQRFNRRHRRRGHVFQDRFKSKLVGDDPYLLRVIRYVHLNRVMTPLVPDLDALARDPWSGHRELMGRTTLRIVQVDWVLALFGPDRDTARERLLSLMRTDLERDDASDDETWAFGTERDGARGVPIAPQPLEAEAVTALTRYVDDATKRREAREAARRRWRSRGWSFERLLDAACRATGADPERVRAGDRKRPAARARALVVLDAVERLGLGRGEVAVRLGVSRSAVDVRLRRGPPRGTDRVLPDLEG
jgi:hypothetical protein